MAMFGLIVSGRMVQTNYETVGEKQLLVTIPEADDVNHIVVFLTGAVAFPDGFGGLVYFSWPDPNAPPLWQLLGYITNEKPSAIFKISNLKKSNDQQTQEAGFLMFQQNKISHVAQIGISIESKAVVDQQAQLLANEAAKNRCQMVEFTQKMLESFLNYAMGFVINPTPNQSYVPMNIVENWYKTFERRLQLNPYFWRQI